MKKHRVEFDFDLNKVAAGVSVVTAVGFVGWWFFTAHATHLIVSEMPSPPELHSQKEEIHDHERILEKLAEGQLQLQNEEKLRQELWGESYRKKISSIVEEYDEKQQSAQ